MDQAAQRNAFEMDRIRRQDKIDAEERDAAASLPAAIKGDPAALAKVTASPKYALPFMQHLEKLDTTQRAKLKEQFEVTGKTAAGILALPEAEQPAAYESAYQNLTAQGYKINLPPKWSPALKNQLQGYAIQVPEHLKLLGDRPTPMGGAPGGFTGQVATDESGGNYNIPNAKGSGAYGKYQFMPETWASVAQANPQLNLPMNMRQATPQQQEAAMEAFTRSNGQALTQVGVPATSANLYLAHRFGVGGATKFLSASDDTPIAALFPPIWIQQNPDLNTTVGQFKRGVQSRYGGIPAGRDVAMGGGAATMPEPAGLSQGDAQPRADASGTPLPPTIGTSDGGAVGGDLLRQIQLPPGAAIATRRGKVTITDGMIEIVYPNGTTGLARMPEKPQAPPSGYRPVGGGLEAIPGGPADPTQARTLAEAKRKAESGGPFAGTGMDAQSMNILLTGDPASPEYALAYSHLSKPRTTIDDQGRPVTIQPMDLSAVRKPAAVAGAPAAPAGGTTTALPGGGTVTVGDSVAPKGPSAPEMAKLRNARAEAEKITAAANDFKAEWAKASPLDRARALSGANTPLNAAYNNFALLAKGDALFQLGVLNGPDLEIIRRTIPDPSTGKSTMTTEADVTSSVDKVLNILNTGISATEKQLGIAPPATQQPAPESGGGQRLTPEEAQKLQPGTTFIGTDGVQRVRR